MKLDELRKQLREVQPDTGAERLAQVIRRLGYPKTADVIARKAPAEVAVSCACGVFVDPSRDTCSRCGRDIVQCVGCDQFYSHSARDSLIYCHPCLKLKTVTP
jgi:hypothetical protein